ncbi:Alpha/Beta hydrolase protein [Mycena olivaceomarginata]|nr:Alpha/Beta hydrolase protein [Mycena olivaceomarginata]
MALRAAALTVLIIYGWTLVGAIQAFLSTSTNIRNSTFTPVGTLEVLSESAFTTLAHPAFPAYGVRLKKSQFCDGVRTTGYIDIEARHLFFYFFESRNDPDTDDVIFWTNGGPGCSSGVGLFMELGPCRVHNAENGTVFHPESWNSNANIFFIDQPSSTTEEAAQDIAAFVAIFFSHFSKFQGRGFHIAGESYGNGMTDVPTMNARLMQCTPASIPPSKTSGETCIQMKARLSRCIKWLKESCQDVFDLINCSTAMAFCQASLMEPYVALGLNNYDLSKKCEGNNHCYNPPVALAFGRLQNDLLHGSTEYVAALLERDIRVLVYVGSYDWVCNWIGNEAWTLALEWSGHAEFAAQPLREWTIDGKRAGRTRSARTFTFATVDGAGHMVPYDKPKESLEMVKRWIAGKTL